MNEEYPTWAPQRWWQDKCNAQAKRIEELNLALGRLVRLIDNTPNGYETLAQGDMAKNIIDNAKKALEVHKR